MISPRKSLELVADLLERAMEESPDKVSLLHALLIQAHTHTILQAVAARRAEARETFAAYPQLEQGPMQ